MKHIFIRLALLFSIIASGLGAMPLAAQNTTLTQELNTRGIKPMTSANIDAAGGDPTARASVRVTQKGYFPIATRASCPFSRSTVAAQRIGGRTRHVLPYGATSLVLVYAGWKLVPAEQPLNTVTVSATATNGSANLTAISGGTLIAGKRIDGSTALPDGTYVVSTDGTSAVLSNTATATVSASLYQGVDLANMHVGIEPTWDAQNSWNSAVNFGENAIKKVVAGGSEQLTVPADGLLFTDPIGIYKTAGSAIGIRQWAPSANGVLSRGANITQLTESGSKGSAIVDRAWNGTSPVGSAGAASYVPIAILGQALDGRRHPAVMVFADSNGYGTISNSDGTTSFDSLDANGASGWIERALEPASAAATTYVAFTNCAAPGDGFKYLFGADSSGTGRSKRLNAASKLGFTHTILALGTNDSSYTLAQLQAMWIAFARELQGAGMKVVAVTPLPKSTSSDFFASQQDAGSTVIRDFAAWLRANAVQTYGAERLVDLNALFADPTDSTKWNLGLTSTLGAPPTYDGIHLNQSAVGYPATVGLLTPQMFSVPISFNLDLPRLPTNDNDGVERAA